MPGRSFGKIEIFERYSTVEVPDADAEFIVDALNNTKINGKKVSVKLCERKLSDKGGSQRHGGSGGNGRRNDRSGRKGRPGGHRRRK